MKLIVFILALTVLRLSFLPCSDGTFAGDTCKTEIGKHEQKGEEQTHDDACSPFCTCNCCAGFTFNFNVPSCQTINLPVVTANFYPFYLSASLREISLPVWQPPQLVA